MWHYPLLAHSNEKSFQITMTAVHLLVLLLFLLFLHRGASDKKKMHTLHRSECCFHSNIFLSLSYYDVFVVVVAAQDCFFCTSSTSIPLYLQRKLSRVPTR